MKINLLNNQIKLILNIKILQKIIIKKIQNKFKNNNNLLKLLKI